MRVLYVEDEKHMALAVAQVLKKSNYSVDLAHDGEEGLDLALSGLYDIIILDIMLPKLDGIAVLSRMRQEGIETPVILLTAKGETEEKVRGLDSGADDYLAKPFQIEELLARLRALGRRKGYLAQGSMLGYADIELNYNTLDLYGNGQTFHLTLKESQLLELLITHQGQAVTNSIIIEKLWGWDSEAGDSHVQVQVAFLRKKLRLLTSRVKIKTIYGVGYMIAPGEEGRADV
ncbi:MAG: response regulator transcription factor [Firmicutes bacterium]|nr:response regulator transcription factor [Bacillota bacterium]